MNRRQRRQATPAADPSWLGTVLAEASERQRAGRAEAAERLYRRVLRAAPEQGDALHGLGLLEHQRGRNERAADFLGRAAACKPRDAFCHYHLGEVRRVLRRHGEAAESYRRALALGFGGADVHFGLGTVLLDLDRAEEAAAELGRAAELSPDDAEIRNNLGNALALTGSPEDAEAQLRAAIRLRPTYAEAHVNLGLLRAEQGRDAEAERSFRAALDAGSDPVEAGRHLARLLLRTGRHDEALELLRRAAEAQPDSAAAARDLAAALDDREAYGEAAEWYRKVLRLSPEDGVAHNGLARCLIQIGRFDLARDHCRTAAALRPDDADVHFNLGVCLQSEGRFAPAVAAHRRAVVLRPDFAEAHYNLALIGGRGGAAGAEEVARLEALLAEPRLGEAARVNLLFALAKALEGRGETDAAFARYRDANALKARGRPFDPRRHLDYVDRLVATFDADFFARRGGFGLASDLPVFIVGMPRAGTTRVEQILAAHPAVHGAGELDDMRRLVGDLPGRLSSAAPFPDCAAEIDRPLAETLARDYEESLRRRRPGAARVTDKMPGNYLRLGLIALLLPGARIIHCRRDPLDTCLSCYFQNFAHGLAFTYDLGHLGLVHRQQERLMAHWRRVLPARILEVRYEDLVADQDTVSRTIVDFCGLPWDPRCLRFHKAARPVRTASFWQVRQPLYATSIGRWRAFRKHLGPLFDSLGLADDGP